MSIGHKSSRAIKHNNYSQHYKKNSRYNNIDIARNSKPYKQQGNGKEEQLHDTATLQFEYIVDAHQHATQVTIEQHELRKYLGRYTQAATHNFCSTIQKGIMFSIPIFCIILYNFFPRVITSLFFAIGIGIHIFSIITKHFLFIEGKKINAYTTTQQYNSKDLRASYLQGNSNKSCDIQHSNTYPVYSILLPVFMEDASILKQLVAAINAIYYPHDKMQVLLILESIDIETIAIVNTMSLPDHWDKVIVPDFAPRTKAKACNYALQMVTGEYVVIFDADDIPDADQLYIALKQFLTSDDKLACLQAKLNYYNADENLLTRLFSIEYTILFDYILPALAKSNYPIPLGGTSNHFRTAVLKQLRGWDIYNLAEDAEIGMRLAIYGYHVDMIDSYTAEESPITVNAWIKQRARWFKGFIQTYLLNMQSNTSFSKVVGCQKSLVSLHLMLGLCVVSLISIPLMLGIGLLKFMDLLPSSNTRFDITLLHASLISCAIWLATTFYQAFIVVRKSPFIKDFSFLKKLLCIAMFPAYFSLHIVAAIYALYDLIRRPFYWSKTKHGLSKIKQKISNIKIKI